MTVDLVITVAILVVAVALFVTERLPFELTAVSVMVALMASGVLPPRDALAGFSNPATVTIAAMFVLSEGVRQTGVLGIVATWIATAGRGRYLATVATLMIGVALSSAFVNNTAAVAIFIPVTLRLAERIAVAPTRLLMPLSFAAMFGGLCTLVGTSTNLLVSSIAAEHGLAPFSMFEFAPLGLLLLAIGFVYLLTIGPRLLPDRGDGDVTRRFALDEYLLDVRVGAAAADVGRTLRHASVTRELDLNVIQVLREDHPVSHEDVVLQGGDVLRVRGDLAAIRGVLERRHLDLLPARGRATPVEPAPRERIVEAVIAVDSSLARSRLSEADLERRYDARVLGIRHHGRLAAGRLRDITLRGGDSLLLVLPENRLQDLERDRTFLFLTARHLQRFRPARAALALGIVAGAVAAAALGLTPIVVSAVAGVVLIVACGCLSVEDACQAIDWKVILLLAGVLPLGLAIERTGLAAVAGELLTRADRFGPIAVLGVVVVLATLLTNVISNQATAVLLAPIVLRSAEALAVDPRPFLVGVTAAASLSFMSPVGYQTNTMIYGAGGYRFRDFLLVGTPLNALLCVVITLAIPWLWPL